jgi:hypothetical protein
MDLCLDESFFAELLVPGHYIHFSFPGSRNVQRELPMTDGTSDGQHGPTELNK